jgi:hypothetical protein
MRLFNPFTKQDMMTLDCPIILQTMNSSLADETMTQSEEQVSI